MSPTDFLQWGPLGAVAAMLATAVVVLFKNMNNSLEAVRTENTELRGALQKQNEATQTIYLTTIASATTAISEALVLVRGLPK